MLWLGVMINDLHYSKHKASVVYVQRTS